MFCENCGANMPDNSKFCTVCGSPMAQAAPPMQQPAEQPIAQPMQQQPNQQQYAQPMQPAGQYVQPPMPYAQQPMNQPVQKKRSMATVIGAVLLLVLAMIAVGLFFFIRQNESSSNRRDDTEERSDTSHQPKETTEETKEETKKETVEETKEEIKEELKEELQEAFIQNGDFSDGLDGWYLWVEGDGAATQGITSDGRMQVTVTDCGTNAWDIQIYSENFSLEIGSQYVISFEVQASTYVSFLTMVQETGGAYNAYFYEMVDASQDTVQVTIPFVPEYEMDYPPNLVFNLGNMQNWAGAYLPQGEYTLWFDNLTIYKLW